MNNQAKKISIVIIGYNTESYLAETLNALNNLHANQEDIEVIYVDDGSTDRSRDLLSNRNDLYSVFKKF